MSPSTAHKGFTLVELMITVAILSLVAAIAVPAYNGYIREGHITNMRSSLNTLRTVIEDFNLENGSYGSSTTLTGITAINGRYNWNPGSIGQYAYTVVVNGTNDYDVWGQFGSTDNWVRCEDRFSTCCDKSSSSSASPSDPC